MSCDLAAVTAPVCPAELTATKGRSSQSQRTKGSLTTDPAQDGTIVMKYLFSSASRRVAVVIAAASVAGLAITGAAFAATSAGTAHAAPAAVPTCTAANLGAWLAI